MFWRCLGMDDKDFICVGGGVMSYWSVVLRPGDGLVGGGIRWTGRYRGDRCRIDE